MRKYQLKDNLAPTGIYKEVFQENINFEWFCPENVRNIKFSIFTDETTVQDYYFQPTTNQKFKIYIDNQKISVILPDTSKIEVTKTSSFSRIEITGFAL